MTKILNFYFWYMKPHAAEKWDFSVLFFTWWASTFHGRAFLIVLTYKQWPVVWCYYIPGWEKMYYGKYLRSQCKQEFESLKNREKLAPYSHWISAHETILISIFINAVSPSFYLLCLCRAVVEADSFCMSI